MSMVCMISSELRDEHEMIVKARRERINKAMLDADETVFYVNESIIKPSGTMFVMRKATSEVDKAILNVDEMTLDRECYVHEEFKFLLTRNQEKLTAIGYADEGDSTWILAKQVLQDIGELAKQQMEGIWK